MTDVERTQAGAKVGMTPADFADYIRQPENLDRRLELIDGEIIEMPSNAYASVIGARIVYYIARWLEETGYGGYVVAADGGFTFGGQVFAPDVAYVRELPTRHGFEPRPPLLAVEVLSDPASRSEQAALRRKLAHYWMAGVVVWIVDFEAREIEVHTPSASVQVYSEGQAVSGGDVLPGFTLAVANVFPPGHPVDTP